MRLLDTHHARSCSQDSSSSSDSSENDSTSDSSTSSWNGSASSASKDSDQDQEYEDSHNLSNNLSKNIKRIFVAIVVIIVLISLAILLKTAEDNTDQQRTTNLSVSTSANGRSNSVPSKSTRSSTTSSPSTSSTPGTSKDLKASGVSRALPSKLRGVNVASLFIVEPWMMPQTWSSWECGDLRSEWECNEKHGLEKMQPRYEKHWETFYSESDFEEMAKLGLNSVRIPFGYWIVDALVGDDYFASGGFKYLKQVLRWCKQSSLFVVLDLHSVPGIAAHEESFAGRIVDKPDFFNEGNYDKAYQVLKNLTISAHTDEDFSTVVMLMVVNEPLQDPSTSLTSTYYPGAQKAIREAEEELGISCKEDIDKCLGIQFMSKHWGAGDPTSHIDTGDRIYFDDHNYAQWIVTEEHTTSNYLAYSCSNTRPIDVKNTITGEWSLSTIGINEGLETAFFNAFFLKQTANFERGAGWFFWSWKTEIDSPQWDYQRAVQAGYIPKDLASLDANACNDFRR